LNKSKIMDWFGNWHFLASFSFKWNHMFCTKWHCFTHCSFFLKAKLCRFNSVVHLIFPLDALQAREEGFFSLATPLSLSLSRPPPPKTQKLIRPTPWPTTRQKNRTDQPCGRPLGHPTSAPWRDRGRVASFALINTRGGQEDREGMKKIN